ncbi:glutaminase, partial [Rhizobiaceae sp. 2RAB30]
MDEIVAEMSGQDDRGKVASYIPELGKVDPARFGMAVATIDGVVTTTGDAELPFSIQSISKVFTLALALGRIGDSVWARVGREPSGTAFNSIVQLEREEGIPRNPFINAGAIVISDILLGGHQPRETIGGILTFIRMVADDETIVVDAEVAASERATGHRNIALAHNMRAI